MPALLLKYILDPRVLLTVGIAAILGTLYFTYHHLESEVTSQKAQITQLSTAVAQKNTEIAQLHTDVANVIARVAAADAARSELNDAINAIDARVRSLNVTLNAKIATATTPLQLQEVVNTDFDSILWCIEQTTTPLLKQDPTYSSKCEAK